MRKSNNMPIHLYQSKKAQRYIGQRVYDDLPWAEQQSNKRKSANDLVPGLAMHPGELLMDELEARDPEYLL